MYSTSTLLQHKREKSKYFFKESRVAPPSAIFILNLKSIQHILKKTFLLKQLFGIVSLFQRYRACYSNVENDKKRVLGILKIYRNFRKRTSDRFNHSPQAQVSRILKNILSSLITTSVQWAHKTKVNLKYKKQVIDKIRLNKSIKPISFFAHLAKKAHQWLDFYSIINALKIHNSYAKWETSNRFVCSHTAINHLVVILGTWCTLHRKNCLL